MKNASPVVPPVAYTIREFCEAYRISVDMFYKMQRGGWAPRVMKVGHRTLISIEAAEKWRRAREKTEPAATK